ncbi:hypothetical protein [Sorangium sp. So ce385]|uniref:hypothetical protein n=1 Tax=Sorangium sp. So ce385 TaxID=3133308 RepID=UPI003F5C3C46
MERGYLLGSCAAVLCALCASACGGAASNLRPGAIAKDRGAICGRVRVVNEGKDITGDCDVDFGGDDEARKRSPTQPRAGRPRPPTSRWPIASATPCASS